MTPPGTLNHRDVLLDLARDLVGVINELHSDTPTPDALGELGFVATWDVGRRERFAKGITEALQASIDANDPTPVEAYLRLMRHADDPVAPQFRASFMDRVGDEVRARTER